MYLDVNAVQQGADLLETAARQIKGHGSFTGLKDSISYSSVSGLDQAGQMHGSISSVSEPEATRGLAQFFASAAELLRQQVDGFAAVDAGIGQTFHSAAGDVSGGVLFSALERPQANPFHVVFPVAGRPGSLEILVSELTATDFASMAGISQNWFSTASVLAQALGELPAALGLLSSSAETEAINNALTNLEYVGLAGQHYVAKSTALGSHTAGLATLSEATALEAAATLGVVRGVVDPVASKSLEEVFLNTFGPRLTTQLAPTVPTFESLLPQMKPGSSQIMDDSGAYVGVPEFTRQGLPQAVNHALTQAGWNDLAHATTPAEVVEQLGTPNPDVLDLIASGATPTQVASATAPSLPPLGALGGVPAGAIGGVAPVGGVGVGGATPAGGVGGLGSPSALGGFGGAMPLAGRGVTGAGAGGFGSGSGGRAGAGGFNTGALGARSGFGAPPGAGTGGVGPTPGAVAGGVAAGSSGPSPRAGSSTGVGGYGVGPAAGTGRGGRNGQHKRGRVQAATSAVEREGNLKALLGEAPEVVPGVIGAWVRQPKR